MDKRNTKAKRIAVDTLSDLYTKYEIVCETQLAPAQKILKELIRKHELKLMKLMNESHKNK